MSGGYFDYVQSRIECSANEVQALIDSNNDTELDPWGDRIGRDYAPEVIEKFQEGVEALRTAAVYLQRIDWLVSGDDGEAQFLERLREELDALEGRA